MKHAHGDSSQLLLEWLQCLDEGRQTHRLRNKIFAALDSDSFDPRLLDQLAATPMRRDFPYHEPETLPDIQDACPSERPAFSPGYQPETCRDQLLGAWYGGLIGERYAAFSPPSAYGDYSPGASYGGPYQNDRPSLGRLTTANLLSLSFLEQYGTTWSGGDVLDHRLASLPYFATQHGDRAAYRNRVMGLSPPETALYRNPWREWNGGLLQGAFWGLVLQSAPKEAAAAAYCYVSVSHSKNGVYGAMLLAAAVSAAAASASLSAVVNAALCELPTRCRLSGALRQVVAWAVESRSAGEIASRIHDEYDDTTNYGRFHVIPNAMIIIMSLLHSGYDLGRAMHLAVLAGFDRAGNAAAVSTVLGMMTGASHMDFRWLAPFEQQLESPLNGQAPVTVDRLVSNTIEQLGLLQKAKPLINL